jgi:vitamin B12 transporter
MSNTKFLAALACLSAPAIAHEAPDADAIIVTATRVPTATDKLASAITVLDQAAIDRSQVTAVSDLLARTPGVTFSRTGGFGTQTYVRIRGAEGDHSVVVIDGVKLNDPSAPGGGYDFGNLLIGDAARIEVLRGPQSTLWGSQAIGGVVNIVSAAPAKPLEGSFNVEAGSRETVSARAGIGGTSESIDWRLGASTFTTDGISALSPALGGVERDGYRNRTGSGRLNVRLADGVSADLRGFYTRGVVDFDGFDSFDSSFNRADTPEYGVTEQWLGYAGLNVALLEGRFKNRVAYARTTIDRDNYDPSSPFGTKTFDARGKNERFEYQGDFTLAEDVNAQFGAEREKSSFHASSPFSADIADARLDSVYGQLNATVLPGLTLTGGVRYDHHDAFGGKTLFAGGGAWSLFDGQTVLRANYAEGFKAPTLYQLYSDYGNRFLRPEQAKSWEAGIEQHLFDRKVRLSATYFDRETTNLIVFLEPDYYYDSVARADARGVELAAVAALGNLSLDANYSWTDTENRSAGSTFGKDLTRRPRHMANGAADYAWPFGLSTGVALRYSGEAFENASNSVRLDDYLLTDVRLSFPIGETLTLFGRVENVFDEDYETAAGYGTLGRSVYAGIRARF